MKTIKIENDNYREIIQSLFKRGDEDFTDVDSVVRDIISDVRKRGDKALREYNEKFDKASLKDLRVTEDEIEKAVLSIDRELLEIIMEAESNIRSFHEKQKEKTFLEVGEDGLILGQLLTPIEKIGIYVPGGKAAYPSTVLMNAMPAIVAGAKRIAMVTPPLEDGSISNVILAAASVAGITEIYKVGGAQSIAALAYGTETIAPVDKIVGPGNIYVARAKREVFGSVGIDMIAGPSEICVVADKSAEPSFIAADLLSQAEHDEMASAVLVTDSMELAKAVKEEVKKQTAASLRKQIIEKSLEDFGYIFITRDVNESMALANELSPEHLELQLENPMEYLPLVRSAGAVFLGKWSPEPMGDYFAGPNHTLPTSGTARFASPLGVYDFMKKTSIISYSRDAFMSQARKVERFAKSEGLFAHANAVRVRL